MRPATARGALFAATLLLCTAGTVSAQLGGAAETSSAEPTWRIGARVSFDPARPDELHGVYLLSWWGDQRWREELRLEGYRRSRLRDGERTWLRELGAAPDGLPALLVLLDGLLTSRLPVGGAGLDAESDPKAIAAESKSGAAEAQDAPDEALVELGDGLHASVVGRLGHAGVELPRRAFVDFEGVTVAVLTVDVLEESEPWSSTLGTPVESSSVVDAARLAERCLNWAQPRVREPSPPKRFKGMNKYDAVHATVAADIDSDGAVGVVEMEKIDAPEAERSLVEQVAAFQFAPARCDGEAVDFRARIPLVVTIQGPELFWGQGRPGQLPIERTYRERVRSQGRRDPWFAWAAGVMERRLRSSMP